MIDANKTILDQDVLDSYTSQIGKPRLNKAAKRRAMLEDLMRKRD